jgi:hypothetical protein
VNFLLIKGLLADHRGSSRPIVARLQTKQKVVTINLVLRLTLASSFQQLPKLTRYLKHERIESSPAGRKLRGDRS